MFSQQKRPLGVALAIAIAAASSGGAVRPAEAQALKSYNAAIGDSSISGISSGAFMAVQFGVAWSSIIKGVGIVAGGPYYCAQAKASDVVTDFTQPIITATGPCMTGPLTDLTPMFDAVKAKAADGTIDSPENIKRQKIYLFHGYNDSVVAKSVADATEKFYQTYLGDGARGNIFYQEAVGAGNSFVVRDHSDSKLDSCPANNSPYIDQCGYDQAGIILQHIYGELNPPTMGKLGGALKSFDQSLYTGNDIPGALSMGDKGYVFVPKDCADTAAACRVHVALHGCRQDVGTIGKLFVEQTGYNAWADANRIIVLYPQTTASPFLPFNPASCWDWWGYVTLDSSYVTKGGKQIAAIKAMLDAMTAGGGGPVPAPGGAAANLIVNDISDTEAALAWAPVAGASLYRISRAGAGGPFQRVGETTGPSFGDQGLAPSTSYAWQVTALIDGVEQAPSNNQASGKTLPTPAACDAPGSCK